MDQAAEALISELRREVEDLKRQLRAALEQLEEANRKAARQAAPFRRRESARVEPAAKKKPGRPAGHKGSRRPVPEQVDETVEVPLTACPSCGGPVEGVAATEQVIEEVPVARPRVTRLVTYRGTCAGGCGEVRSRHPLQTSDAGGAAKVQLGPRAKALAIALRHRSGLTMRTACRVLKEHFGLRLSPGGLSAAVRRAAGRVKPAFDRLIKKVRGSEAVFVDETSWYVGDAGHWLWTFTTADTTVYIVSAVRGRSVVATTMGSSYQGVVVSDCLNIYDNLPFDTHKCIAHHQRAITAARARPDTLDPTHLDRWKHFFRAVSEAWRRRDDLSPTLWARLRAALDGCLDRLLGAKRTQPGDRAIQQRIGKRRDSILTCLDHPAAEPTNNRAERSLRPAVIARKLSCGNRTAAGAEAWQTITSLAATFDQRGRDFTEWLTASLSLAGPRPPLPRAIAR